MGNSAKIAGLALFAAALLFAAQTAAAKTVTIINPNSRVYAYHGVVTAVPNVPVIMPGMIYYPPVRTPEVRIYTWPQENVRPYYVPPAGNAYIAEHGMVTMLPPADSIVINARNP